MLNNVRYDWKALGAAVRNRLKYGDSVRQIAEEIGINYGTFHRARRGFALSMENALKICTWLDRDVNDFVVREQEPAA